LSAVTVSGAGATAWPPSSVPWLPAKVASPLKIAVTVCVPAVRLAVQMLALPPVSGTAGLTHHFFRAYAPLFPAFLRVFHVNYVVII